MVNARRKISNPGRDGIEVPLASADDKDRRDPVNKAKQMAMSAVASTKGEFCGKIITGLIILVVLLDVYWYATPHETKVAHFKSLHEQMSGFANDLHERKSDIKEAAEEVSERIEDDKSSLADYLPIVGKSHHETEMSSLKAEYDKLSKEKQEVVDKMQEQIKKNEELLEKLKKAQAAIGIDTDKFCPECRFTAQNMNTSCGKRKDFLVQNYGNTEEDAIQAVMKWDSGCMKD